MGATTIRQFEPKGAVLKAFHDRSAELVLSGPAGTGKSFGLLMKIHLTCLAQPGIQCLIVRKTHVALASTTLVTFKQKVANEALAVGAVKEYGGSATEPASFRYENGSRILVGGMDNPTKVLSSEYDLIFADEATELSVTDWETLGTRLRHNVLSYQQQLGACNPDAPGHWLKQRADRGVTKMLESRHEENPLLFGDDGTITEFGKTYLRRLDSLTGVRRQRYRLGLWTAAEGIIFEGFDPAIHVIDRFAVPDTWTRWWGVDFGYNNPFCWQNWAEDPDSGLYLTREIYWTQRLVEDHAREILLQVTAPTATAQPDDVADARAIQAAVYDGRRCWTEPKPRSIICDHDSEDRATLERHIGRPTFPAKKTVSDGIEAVKVRMRKGGDGKPRIYFFADALVERDPELDDVKKPCSTIEEIPGYVWATREKDIRDDKALKEEPLKVNDHGCDVTRYICMERDLVGRPTIRGFGR